MSRLGPTVAARVRKVREGRSLDAEDILATEEPLEIRLATTEDGQEVVRSLAVTMRTPGNDFELAVGFLYGEGIVRGKRDVDRVVYSSTPIVEQEFNIVSVHLKEGVAYVPDLVERHFYTTSACGVCGKTSLEAVKVRGAKPIPRDRLRVDGRVISSLPERLRESQEVFSATGGLHAAGLFDARGRLESVREDVGRHNAVDKLVGQQVLTDRVPLHDSILAVSGRASFEILQKAAVAGIPMVVAVGAPSNLAVDLAKQFGITLVGFARGSTFNMYTEPHRVVNTSARKSR